MKEKDILTAVEARLGIAALNPMQQAMAAARGESILLLGPTGSGKTLAFAIAMLRRLPAPDGSTRGVVIAPTRELAVQIGGVLAKAAPAMRVLTFYGGHSMKDETASLAGAVPDIIVATPGRLLDHINRGQVNLRGVKVTVLDEYDKSLELGFADDMRRIVRAIGHPECLILTSATPLAQYPDYLNPQRMNTLDFTASARGTEQPRVERLHVTSWQKDKLQTLGELVASLEDDGRTMIFVNHRESAERVYNYLRKEGFPAGLYHGGLEQNDREDALEMFNNGTTPILVTTDLGSRGLDIAETRNIIHYHQPGNAETWTHRNGRTGRLGGSDGRVFVITAEDEPVTDGVEWEREYHPRAVENPLRATVATLYFNIGKREKISRGDIVGFLVNKGGLVAGEIGRIALRDHNALVAIPAARAREVVEALKGEKIKNKRVKVTLK